MSFKKRGLGRGLDALLAGTSSGTIETAPSEATHSSDHLQEIELDRIQRGRYQPRRDMEPLALEELAKSIKAQGVIQPIVVRTLSSGSFEIIAGERRWRAAGMAGLDRIPVVIREVPDDAAIAMALIENIQREDLNPIEEAVALLRLQEEFELTQQQVADAVGKSRTTIANILRLNHLTEDVKRMVEHGDLEMGHARALLTLQSELQIETAREVAAKGMTVRQTEALVKKLQEEGVSEKKVQKIEPDHQVKNWVNSLSKRLATKVTISNNAKGGGKIVINFDTNEVLTNVIQQLQE